MTGSKALWARPACDPELPAEFRLLVTEPLAARRPSRDRLWPWRRQAEQQLARHRARVVLPHDLDDGDRRVLARAQVAIETILCSRVRTEGLVEADEPVLRRHEWDIAVALLEITQLRRLNTAQDPAGAMTAAVLDSQQRAVMLAADSATARVAALERFAAQVEAADDARRDWREALELAGLNDRYLDLVARTAADQLAVTEIDDLTERADVAARALQDSLRAASDSAAVLALPPAG
jgi:hypothetical protein